MADRTMSESAAAPRQGILSLSIKEKSALLSAYMPFVINGGLFIPTKREYEMGEEVFMLLKLMDEVERLPIAGKIIWKTPAGADGYRAAGVGVQFSDQDGGTARNKIENYLAGILESDRSTHTM
jgi:type IV pilus assembly protein PilZ